MNTINERKNTALSARMADIAAQEHDKQNGTKPRSHGHHGNHAARALAGVSDTSRTAATSELSDATLSESSLPHGSAESGKRNFLGIQINHLRYVPAPEITLDSPNVSAAVDTLPKEPLSFAAVIVTLKNMMQAQKSWDRMQRTAGFTVQIQGLQSAAEEIRSSAKMQFAASMTQSVTQVAAGAAQMGMSAGALRMTKTEISLGRKASDLSAKIEADPSLKCASAKTLANLEDGSSLAHGKAAHWNNVSQGVGASGQGIGGLGSAPMQYESQMADARRADQETAAKRGEALSSQSSESMQSESDVIRSLDEDLKSLLMTPLEAQRRVNANIA
ncbi:hypothetical protein [Pandoraea pnomenusa]|uniref:hypothetical protein n=1 Tax=Pandoraea pnomenusa TaxID=93220 RepID=UPI001AC6F697|nr:hypothetical protein [Pandoraea pnomenusa]MBN9096141.1 hypothetical protein [Pandoraea pnomenusa]